MQQHEMLRDMNGRAREECSGGSSGDDDNICRDFLRNVCRRGKRCKFRHPDSSGEPGPAQQNNTGTSEEGKAELTFCHDYQNGHCTRPVCRFIHCTSKDEDSYYQSGDIPPPILDQAIRKGQLGDITLNGDVPICKDYLNGDCTRRRGGKCKFRHLSVREYEDEIYGPGSRDGSRDREGGFGGTGVPFRDLDSGALNSHYDHSNTPDRIPNLPSPDPKRQRLDPDHHPHDYQREGDFMMPLDEMGREMMSRDISLRDFRDRERERDKDRRGLEELLIMRKQIDGLKKENSSLKKEVSDLRATNEFLLDQRAGCKCTERGGGWNVRSQLGRDTGDNIAAEQSWGEHGRYHANSEPGLGHPRSHQRPTPYSRPLSAHAHHIGRFSGGSSSPTPGPSPIPGFTAGSRAPFSGGGGGSSRDLHSGWVHHRGGRVSPSSSVDCFPEPTDLHLHDMLDTLRPEHASDHLHERGHGASRFLSDHDAAGTKTAAAVNRWEADHCRYDEPARSDSAWARAREFQTTDAVNQRDTSFDRERFRLFRCSE